MDIVKVVPQTQRLKQLGNISWNDTILSYYWRMAYSSVRNKEPRHMIDGMSKRMNRLDACNRYWVVDTYEVSQVKILLHTYLCKDKFCHNCKRVRQIVMRNRYAPHMEQYKDSLYHMTLTVPDCSGESMATTISHMTTCFKILICYLSGNKKIKGLDLMQYGYKGCIRTLEVTYKGDSYHPHFHVAAVFDNPIVADNKHIINQFSKSKYGKERSFSEFEALIQRIWWLLVNRIRLTIETIFGDRARRDRYSCIVDKFQSEDYDSLLGYMTKTRTVDNKSMSYENFKTLYNALDRVRQIQGYGVFYNVKSDTDSTEYTEEECAALAAYISGEEQPTFSSFSVSKIANDNKYTPISEE